MVGLWVQWGLNPVDICIRPYCKLQKSVQASVSAWLSIVGGDEGQDGGACLGGVASKFFSPLVRVFVWPFWGVGILIKIRERSIEKNYSYIGRGSAYCWKFSICDCGREWFSDRRGHCDRLLSEAIFWRLPIATLSGDISRYRGLRCSGYGWDH